MKDTEKIIDYKLIWGSESKYIEKEVSRSISEGWQPYGVLVYADSNSVLIQTMVKYGKLRKVNKDEI